MSRRVVWLALSVAVVVGSCEAPGPLDTVDASLSTLEGELTAICGGPKSLPCSDGQFCQGRPGLCDTTSAAGTCVAPPASCPTTLAPECGCDGESYDNACLRQQAGVAEGPPDSCGTPCSLDAPCADGETCDVRACGTDAGRCILLPEACPRGWAPVCGCDGKTYPTECKRLAAGVALAHKGLCPPPCGPEAPPCADGHVCSRPVGVCDEAAPGVCLLAPRTCTVGDPVCGCDGQTRQSACAALAEGADIAALGPCEDMWCAPCGSDSECGAGLVCASHGAEGSFCAALCDGPCEAGTTCQSVMTGAGAVDACLPQGECGCSEAAIQSGATTACTVSNADGTCSGTRTCTPGGLTACSAKAPSAEVCNGEDDDCDGEADDGNPGGGAPCTTGKQGACAAGTTACTPAGIVCIQNTQPSAETCNGTDDDCNGAIDNGNPGGGATCNTGKLGVCAPGTTACSAGAVVCNQSVQASAETCNGKDDNCNGAIDDGNPGGGATCSTGKQGVCAAGTTACSQGAVVCYQSVQASAETCNGKDDNCNGAIDDGNPGGGATCSTGKQGVCAAGTTACSQGAVVCNQSVQASAETCNGKDDNCNGAVDDGNPGGGATCSTGKQGVCAAGTTACSQGSVVCNQSVQASAETCNGKDDNCNGAVDDGNPGGGATCSTGQQGVCAAGTTTCSQGSVVCNQSVQASAETCGDGLDNDCNGQVDNACAVPVTWTNDIKPIATAKCTSCHSGASPGACSGSMCLASFYADTQQPSYYCAGKTKGACALVRIQNGSMPFGKGCTGNPAQDAGKAGCLTASEQAVFQAWIDGGQLQ